MDKAIAIIGTADTKGEELQYIKGLVHSYGLRPVVIDTGILGEPVIVRPDITKHQVAAAGGHTIETLISRGSRGAAVEGMRDGLSAVVKSLYHQGLIHGMLAIGGAEGSVLAAAAMAVLPLGVPKLTVSPIASGNHLFKEIVGYNDAMVMHSVIDILGINDISSVVFDNAVAAVVGMINAKHPRLPSTAKKIAISMLGTVTKPIMNVIKPKLEGLGYQVYTFHANGVGGDCMDELIREGRFSGVIDYALNELVGMNYGGYHASSKRRMEAALEAGVPTVVVPGVTNILVTSVAHATDPKFDGRKKYKHNPEITLVAITEDEMHTVADTLISKLNAARAKDRVRIAVPLGGLCSQDMENLALHNPQVNKVLFRRMREELHGFQMTEMDAHINDSHFADMVCDMLISLMADKSV